MTSARRWVRPSFSFYKRTAGSRRHPGPRTVQGVPDNANPKSRLARRAQPVPRGMATAQASAAGHAATTPRLPATAPPAGPHPAGPTHRCSEQRRSGRASGRCALRRDRLQVSGCELRPGSGAAGVYSPSPGEMVSTCTPMAAAALAEEKNAGGGATGGVEPERTWRRFRCSASSLSCLLRTRTALHATPRPACARRSHP